MARAVVVVVQANAGAPIPYLTTDESAAHSPEGNIEASSHLRASWAAGVRRTKGEGGSGVDGEEEEEEVASATFNITFSRRLAREHAYEDGGYGSGRIGSMKERGEERAGRGESRERREPGEERAGRGGEDEVGEPGREEAYCHSE